MAVPRCQFPIAGGSRRVAPSPSGFSFPFLDDTAPNAAITSSSSVQGRDEDPSRGMALESSTNELSPHRSVWRPTLCTLPEEDEAPSAHAAAQSHVPQRVSAQDWLAVTSDSVWLSCRTFSLNITGCNYFVGQGCCRKMWMQKYRELPWDRIRVNSLTREVELKIKRKVLSCITLLYQPAIHLVSGCWFGENNQGNLRFRVLDDASLVLDGRRLATKAY